jgi:hypothetical protein
MNPMDTLTADLIYAVRASRERLLSQEHFLEQLKASGEGLLSQEKLLPLLFCYRKSLARQEQLLHELRHFTLLSGIHKIRVQK